MNKAKSNPIFEANMRALKKRQPLLAQRMLEISNIKNPYPLKKRETKNGSWWSGFYDEPFFQSNTSLDVTPDGVKPVLVVAGIGTPEYLVKVLNKSLKRRVIVLVEPNIKLLLFAMESVAFFNEEGKSSVYFLLGEEDSLLKEMMGSAFSDKGNLIAGYCDFIFHHGEMELASDTIGTIINKYKSNIVLQMQRLGDSAEDTLLGFRQMALAAPWIVARETLKPLKGKFKGYSGVVLSAGPSLDKNIELIRGLEDKLIIVAADTLLGKLSKMGIKPHFVCALERGPLTYEKYFKPLYDIEDPFLDDIVLVAQSVCYPQIVGRWPGRVSVVGKDGITLDEAIISKSLGGVQLRSGASVAHMALGLLDYIGVERAALIGQDLAFAEDGKTHSSDTAWSESGGVEKKRKKIKVPGSLAPEVQTTKIWKMFIDIFEDMIPSLEVPVWDCTEGGALIRGARISPLSDFLEKLSDCSDSYNLVSSIIELRSLQDIDVVSTSLNKVKKMFIDSLDKIERAQLFIGKLDRGEEENCNLLAPILQDLVDGNSILSYIGQSYLAVMLADELRFDKSKREERKKWIESHVSFLEAQKKSSLVFLNWLNYMASSVRMVDSLLSIGMRERPVESENVKKSGILLSTIQHKKMEVEELVELDFAISRCDLISSCHDPITLCLSGRHLYSEGRYQEASKHFQSAIEKLEGKNISLDIARDILKERAKCLMGRDLCWGGRAQEALVSLANAYRYGSEDQEIIDLLKILMTRRVEDLEDVLEVDKTEKMTNLLPNLIFNLREDLALIESGDLDTIEKYLVKIIS